MLEWANLLTGLVSFVTSLAVGIILRNKDRKEAEKIRQED
ncbi:hypothetical protein O99_00450 [Bartonella rochalimae ATCC BAA-1498]|uniref:Uncharacterized protein n=1 Tax=Bartonella rochalimae ATCC BAA-1498 TaxID=685782 RepID=E6YMF3_9HYPH|nr:hypothetical protein O99_00450 [Bartonella rochalimae ATCC BAA-1498]CBI78055.1 conserved hypothetical protein [Bartonella rochalimae ATCC BAA-1498]